MCHPQQSGTSWKVFLPEPSGSLSAMCTRHLTNSVYYLHWNHPEPHRPSEPEPSGTSLAMTRTVRKLVSFCHFATELSTNRAYCLHRKPLQPCLLSAPRSAPEPSGTSSAICTGTLRNLISHLPGTLRNLISHLHENPPEPHQPSAPETSGTSSTICPEPAGTSSAICTGTLRNLVCYLHRNPPELHQPFAPEPAGTLRNLLRNLVLQLHRIAPELFWAQDPIASFAVGEKSDENDSCGMLWYVAPACTLSVFIQCPQWQNRKWQEARLDCTFWSAFPTAGIKQPETRWFKGSF